MMETHVQGISILAVEARMKPGSFDDHRGWGMPPSTTTTKDMDEQQHRRACRGRSWLVTTKQRHDDIGCRRSKEGTGRKGLQPLHMILYITARTGSVGESTPITNYWDKVRQIYFDDRDCIVTTNPPISKTTDGTIIVAVSLSTMFDEYCILNCLPGIIIYLLWGINSGLSQT